MTETNSDSTSGQSSDWSKWIAICGVAGIFIINLVIAGFESAAGPAFVLGMALGATLAPVLIGGGIGFFVGRSTKQPIAGFISGTMVLFVLSAIGTYPRLSELYSERIREKQDAAQAVAGMRKDARALVDFSNGKGAIPTDATAPGEFGEIQKFFRMEVERLATIGRDYRQELHNIGFEQMLNAERISKDAGLADSRRMVVRAREIVGNYTLKSRSAMQDIETDIKSLPVSESLRNGTLVGFQKAVRSNHMNEIWDKEAKIVQNMDNIVTLLASSKRWTVQGSKVVFADQAELAQFNADIVSINRLRKEETALRKELQTEMDSKLESVQRELQ